MATRSIASMTLSFGARLSAAEVMLPCIRTRTENQAVAID
jgi:hypothetical protein